jgi:hypothetical protein
MIVYILGEAHSGKSEASKHLRKKFKLIEIALADPMKRFLAELYGFTEEQLWGPSEMRNMPDPRFPRVVDSFDEGDAFEADRFGIQDPGKVECLSAREALQTMGEAMRSCWSDTWVRKLFETMKELERGAVGYLPPIGLFGDGHPAMGLKPEHPLGPFFDFLVPDVRYRNEHLALREAGAVGIRLTSPSQGKGLTGKLAHHRSETEQRSIPDSELDAVICNDGTLDDLYARLDAVLKERSD